MKKKLFVWTVVAASLTIGLAGVAFADDHQDRCSVETLQGRYVFSASGKATPSSRRRSSTRRFSACPAPVIFVGRTVRISSASPRA